MEMNAAMKRRAILFLLLVLAGLAQWACALEIYTEADGSIRFDAKSNRLFDQPVLPLSNRNLLVSVNSSPTGGAYQTWVVCIAPDGEKLWAEPVARNEQSLFVRHMQEYEDGTIVLTVSKHRFKDRQLLGLDPNSGSMLWQKESVEIFPDERITDEKIRIQSIPVGEYFLSSEMHDYPSTCEPAYLQLETQSGEVLWRTQDAPLGMLEVDPDRAWPVDQDVLLSGRNADGAVVQRMDQRGNMIWQSVLPEGFVAEQVLVTQSGEILLCSIANSQGSDSARWDQRNFLCLSAESGQLRWHKQQSVPKDQFARLQSILEIPQGYLCVANRMDRRALSCFLLDREGNEQFSWAAGQRVLHETILQAELFFWQNQPWAIVSFNTSDNELDAALVPLQLPQGL